MKQGLFSFFAFVIIATVTLAWIRYKIDDAISRAASSNHQAAATK